MIKPLTGVGLGVTSALLNDWSLALFNVPVTVLGMAAAGSILSFAYDVDGGVKMSRKRLYFLAIANAIIAAATVSLIPKWMGWDWMNHGLEGSLALLLAATARFAIPAFIKLIPEIISRILKLGKYRTNASLYDSNDSGEWSSRNYERSYEDIPNTEDESK